MTLSWKDAATAILAILAALVIYAKTAAYSWWLIGSWNGAIGTLGVIGFAMLVINLGDLLYGVLWQVWTEAVLWSAAGALVLIAVFIDSEALFYTAAAVLGCVWLFSLIRHLWGSTHPIQPTIGYTVS